MKDDFQRRIQRYGWDWAVDHYDSGWRRPLKPAQDRLLAAVDLRSGEDILDVACGTGLVTIPAAEAVAPGGRAVGTDLSEEMVEQGRQRAEEQGLRNVTFEHMGAEALELPEGAFDAALCALGLMYVPDPEQALREMHRVLTPGGRMAAVVWGARKNCGWAEVFPIVDRRVDSEVCPLFFRLGTGDALKAAFRTAGFDDVTAERFSVALPFGSAEAACEAIFWGGPVALAWRKFDEATRAEARAEYLDSIAPYRTGDGYAIPGEFVIARGMK